MRRSLRVDSVPVHRAMLTDREGIPLAIGIPAVSIWMNPQEITHFEAYDWQALSDALGVSVLLIRNKIEAHRHKTIHLFKDVCPPEQAKAFDSLKAVHQRQEFKRFYPQGAMAAHWVGKTNVDDQGIDGAELLFDKELTGVRGASLVVRDRGRWSDA